MGKAGHALLVHICLFLGRVVFHFSLQVSFVVPVAIERTCVRLVRSPDIGQFFRFFVGFSGNLPACVPILVG